MDKIEDLIFLDIESLSAIDIRKTGSYVYAESDTTDIHVIQLAAGSGELIRWVPGDPVPEIVKRPGVLFSAHNWGGFEYVMWTRILTPRYGWPAITYDRGHCTAAEAAVMALPRALEDVGHALGLPVKKDMEGNRLMLRMAKPRQVMTLEEFQAKFPQEEIGRRKPGFPLPEFTQSKTGAVYRWWTQDREKNDRLYAYCAQDVTVAREVFKKLKRLSPMERAIWVIDGEINERGIYLDIPAITDAQVVVEKTLERSNSKICELTDQSAPTVNSLAKLTAWMAGHGVQTTTLDKNALQALMKTDLPEKVRQVLEIRAAAGAASVKKLKAMLLCASADYRARGCFLFSGAGTRRWTSLRLQLQNILRDTANDVDAIVDILQFRDPELLEMIFGPAIVVISKCLRGMIKAKTGCTLRIADYSNIEGRANAYLAGEEKTLEAFRAYDTLLLDERGAPILDEKGEAKRVGPDLYKVAAAGIYGVPIAKVTKDQRQVGKVATLAFGYGGGVGAVAKMAEGYGLNIGLALPALWEAAPTLRRREAVRAWVKAKKPGYSESGKAARNTYVAADLMKQGWRADNPNIVQFWKDLQKAATAAVKNPGKVTSVRSIRYVMADGMLWCGLPSGGRICYPSPRLEKMKMPWDDVDLPRDKWSTGLTYMGVNSVTRKWERQKAYGGLLLENVVQSFCRDLLANAMKNLRADGYRIVMHAHDEIVAEVPQGFGSLEAFGARMCEPPSWAIGMPIAWAGEDSERYKK